MTDEYKARPPYSVAVPAGTVLRGWIIDKFGRRFKTLEEAQELARELHQIKPDLELEILDGKNVVIEKVDSQRAEA